MKGRFKASWQIVLALALVLSLATAAPVAALSPQVPPSISPVSVDYSLDAPPSDVSTTISWGQATLVQSIKDIPTGKTLTAGTDYAIVGNTLTIYAGYLAPNLTAFGATMVLNITFDSDVSPLPGNDIATLLINTVGTPPSVSPAAAFYSLEPPSPTVVSTEISWGAALSIVSIQTAPWCLNCSGYTLVKGTDYIEDGNTLSFLNNFLTSNATTCMQVAGFVVLNITFSTGPPYVYFTILAAGDVPSFSGSEFNLDKAPPPPIFGSSAVINYGIAPLGSTPTLLGASLNGVPLSGAPLTALGGAFVVNVAGNWMLMFPGAILTAAGMASIGDVVDMVWEFNALDPNTGLNHTAPLTITAVGTTPNLSPKTGNYNVDLLKIGVPQDQFTQITWGPAGNISVWFGTRQVWMGPGNWTLGATTLYGTAVLNISAAWLTNAVYGAGLADLGDSATLTIVFNNTQWIGGTLMSPADTFTVTVAGTGAGLASLSPAVADFDMDPGLAHNVSCTVVWGDAVTQNLTTLMDVTDFYAPNSMAYGSYPYGGNFTLKSTIPGYESELIIYDQYLTSRFTGREMGDALTIIAQFDDPAQTKAPFVITGVGTSATLDPTAASFDVDDANNITVIITWRSAWAVDNIRTTDYVDLKAGTDYTVTNISATPVTKAKLVIMADYLEDELEEVGDTLDLVVDFNVGLDSTITITAIGTPVTFCFIATAAYGTPMAEEIQILREFRDEYLLTNPLGRALVDLYYRVSPPIAQFIAEHPALQLAVRAMLVPALAMSTVAVNTSLATPITILSLVLAAIAVAAWASRRRERRAYA